MINYLVITYHIILGARHRNGYWMPFFFVAQLEQQKVRSGLAHARLQGTRLGRPPTAAGKAGSVTDLFLAGISKSEIARRLKIGRTSVRRLLEQKKS